MKVHSSLKTDLEKNAYGEQLVKAASKGVQVQKKMCGVQNVCGGDVYDL